MGILAGIYLYETRETHNMKKIYSLLSIALLTATVSTAQVNIQDYNGGSPSGTMYNGTTISRTVTDDELVVVDLGVTNSFGMDKTLSVTRVKLNEVASWASSEQICWGYQAEGNCYTTPFISPNPWTSPAWGSALPNNAVANLKFDIHTNSAGTIHYRFYVNDGATKVDSVDVIVTTLLGIKDKKNEEIAVSIYPNPATSVMNISASGLDGNYDVKMTDVLGKVVYNETVVGSAKKVDVSDFKNGVYLVTITEKGTAIQTRRIVVKH